MRVADDIAAKGIGTREAPKFGEKLVAGDVIVPGGGHGALEGKSIIFIFTGGSDALDSAELCQGVDAMGLKRGDELLDGGLGELSDEEHVVRVDRLGPLTRER